MHNKCRWETSKANLQQHQELDVKDQQIMAGMGLMVLANRVDARCLNVRAEIQNSGKTEEQRGHDP
jgi:hypothetical protein